MLPSTFDSIVHAVRLHIYTEINRFSEKKIHGRKTVTLGLSPTHCSVPWYSQFGSLEVCYIFNESSTFVDITAPIIIIYHDYTIYSSCSVCGWISRQSEPYGPLHRRNIRLLQQKKYLQKFRKTSMFAGIFQILLEVQTESNQNQMPSVLWQPVF
jgi:hypothetical protein